MPTDSEGASGVVAGWRVFVGEWRGPAAGGLDLCAGPGIDTVVGRFVSPDGRLEIGFDIGYWAGCRGETSEVLLRRDDLVDGELVQFVRSRTNEDGKPRYEWVVRIPARDRANFWLRSMRADDLKIMESLARSFRRKGQATQGGTCPLAPANPG